MTRRTRAWLAIFAMGLVGAGFALVWYPLALIGVGGLLWADLKIDEVRRK